VYSKTREDRLRGSSCAARIWERGPTCNLGLFPTLRQRGDRETAPLGRMILAVDEIDNSHSVTLEIGYEFVRDAEPQLGRGGGYKRVRDAGAIAVGPAHAVETGERRSICGKTMQKIEGRWPPVMA